MKHTLDFIKRLFASVRQNKELKNFEFEGNYFTLRSSKDEYLQFELSTGLVVLVYRQDYKEGYGYMIFMDDYLFNTENDFKLGGERLTVIAGLESVPEEVKQEIVTHWLTELLPPRLLKHGLCGTVELEGGSLVFTTNVAGDRIETVFTLIIGGLIFSPRFNLYYEIGKLKSSTFHCGAKNNYYHKSFNDALYPYIMKEVKEQK